MAGTSWDRLGLVDQAFEAVAPVLRRFAAATGLRLLEFFRDDPVWRLAFARQAGGEAAIDVGWDAERPDQYAVSASWWVDDYDSASRRWRREEVGVYDRNRQPEDLEAMLQLALGRIDGWTEADLDRISGPHPEWRDIPREDFVRSRLPRR